MPGNGSRATLKQLVAASDLFRSVEFNSLFLMGLTLSLRHEFSGCGPNVSGVGNGQVDLRAHRSEHIGSMGHRRKSIAGHLGVLVVRWRLACGREPGRIAASLSIDVGGHS